MINLKDSSHIPTRDEISQYINNPLFDNLCDYLSDTLNAKTQIDYSKCSMEPGWNIKFKRSGKSLCTVYPREGYFTLMVVVGAKEKDAVQSLLPNFSQRMRDIYNNTKEGNGQRWLMIDLEDNDPVYSDALQIIKLRAPGRKSDITASHAVDNRP